MCKKENCNSTVIENCNSPVIVHDGSSWNYPKLRLQIPGLIKMFGKPAYDVKTAGGVVAWNNAGIFSALFLEDNVWFHKTFCHCDSLEAAFIYYIPTELIGRASAINESFGYNAIRNLMIVLCHDVTDITIISYAILKYLDHKLFPRECKHFSVEDARETIQYLHKKIKKEHECNLLTCIEKKILKYVERNNEKYKEKINKDKVCQIKPCH